MLRIVGVFFAASSLTFAVGLQLSGIQNPYLTLAFWGLSGLTFVIGVILFVVSAIRQISPKRKLEAPSSMPGHIQADVVSIGQTGGQTAREIYNIGKQPRTLTGINLAPVRDTLSEIKGDISITARLGNPEAEAFASELMQFLRECGWTVQGVNQDLTVGQYIHGVVMRIPTNEPDNASHALVDWLLRMQLPVEYKRNSNRDKPDLYISG